MNTSDLSQLIKLYENKGASSGTEKQKTNWPLSSDDYHRRNDNYAWLVRHKKQEIITALHLMLRNAGIQDSEEQKRMMEPILNMVDKIASNAVSDYIDMKEQGMIDE